MGTALARHRRAAQPDGGSPVRGLKAFQREDAGRFHGREKLTAKLLELTRTRPFAGVFGASGSGKSSLLRAGLLPRLDQALIFTPGVQPLAECAVRLAQLTGHSAVVLHSELTDPAALGLLVRQHDENLVLVVDQFEEVFTLASPEQRDWFVQALVSAPHVVIGVRADFYGHVGRHPELVEALEGGQLLVGPLTTDELRRAIVEPARHVGAIVESALVTRLVADVAGQAAALPLVQHALVETWHRRRGMTLSLAGYEEAGGVEHAIARTAEAVYTQFDHDQQQIARRTFLRLIALGEGTEDTKRRANREDLDAEVLDRLANARLVTLTEQHAELTHEALIRSWPRLRDWIAEDREKLRVHHRLTEAAAGWDGDRDLLYQGTRLAQAADLDTTDLTEPERAFLTASQAAGRRRTRRARAVISVLSVLVLLLAGTAVFAVTKTREATQQRNDALAGRAAAEVMRLIPADPLQAARLALAAYAVTPGQVTRDAVLNADAARQLRNLRGDPELIGATLTMQTDGELIIAAGKPGPARIMTRYGPLSNAPLIGTDVVGVLLTADDRRVFAFERSGVTGIWNVEDPAHPKQIGVLPLGLDDRWRDINDDGTWLAVTRYEIKEFYENKGSRGRATVWDLRDPANPRSFTLPSESVSQADVAPDGRKLSVLEWDEANKSNTVQIWDLGDVKPRPGVKMRVGRESIDATIGNGGQRLALKSLDKIEVWDLSASPPAPRVTVPRLPANDTAQIAFSADDRQIAVLGKNTVEIWDVEDEGEAVTAGSFSSFQQPEGLRYRPREKSFAVFDAGPSTWALSTDMEKVRDGLCREREIALTDDEWRRYFSDVARVPVC
ncbi:WD40 repeat domain-containing protein [Lentzea californiensis]|uniref:WD40 repeat domain-containing protein n=1 Tax=Lentzea californiensis TaxID=438851 RepID=UPI002166192B|nr:WD40 repeat domain-containing protein [Lentzea californiensis]MCR3753361.1 hypothetical protein [Lentzea californiensis]